MAARLKVVVDTSVWIDYYRDADLPHAALLDGLIEDHTIVIPSIVLLEVLRGVPNERTAVALEADFRAYSRVDICTNEIALKAAQNYRTLRSRAITVRSSIDLQIGTWCMENDVFLLHNDRDFAGMEKYLGLKFWPLAG